VAPLAVATVSRPEGEIVEQAHRILHSLIAERQQLQGRADAAELAAANRIAIGYWRCVIADKLRGAAR
jgi:hypothetical protein